MIKHIVLSSGLYYGLHQIGILAHLHKKKFFNIDKIETIYGCSIGAIVGSVLCLKMDFKTVITYFQDRPWGKDIDLSPTVLLNSFHSKGVFDEDIINIMFKNILFSKDLSLNITMLDLYKYSNIEFHCYTIELEHFKSIDISYKTHPNMKLITALYQTTAFPLIFKPCYYMNKYFVDGALINWYPLNNCINDHNPTEEEILGIYTFDIGLGNIEKMSFLGYAFYIYNRLSNLCQEKRKKIKNEIKIDVKEFVANIYYFLNSKKIRKKYIKTGKKLAKDFLQL